MIKNNECIFCNNGIKKYYQVPITDSETNKTIVIKMSEEQKDQYDQCLKQIYNTSDNENKASIILSTNGCEIKWKK